MFEVAGDLRRLSAYFKNPAKDAKIAAGRSATVHILLFCFSKIIFVSMFLWAQVKSIYCAYNTTKANQHIIYRLL